MIPIQTNFDAEFSLETEATLIPEEPPFHILFLGDYSGRLNLQKNNIPSPLTYQVLEIDRDNFDEVLNQLNATIYIDLEGDERNIIRLDFNELEDFHPDKIFQQISLFSELRHKRDELLNPDTFDDASKDVRSWMSPHSPNESSSISNSESSLPSSRDLLDDILGEKNIDSGSYTNSVSSFPSLDTFIKDIVSSHVININESEQSRLIDFIDEATSQLMRKILHHKDFQALESAWRGLYFVVRKVETNNNLKLFLMDLSKEEFSTSLNKISDLQYSNAFLHSLNNDPQSGDSKPWALICGNYEFELTTIDMSTLRTMGEIGESLIAPFISYINPQMLGVDSLSATPLRSNFNFSDDTDKSQLWKLIRSTFQAKYLSFATPRFLARLPYGQDTEPTEVFSFEEFTKPTEHDKYLWSNPSYVCAVLLAQSFSAFAWNFRNKLIDEINGLPTHVYSANNEFYTKSCLEISITQTSCKLLLEQGLNPLISFKNTDTLKLADLRSIAINPKSLLGKWK